MRYRIDQLEIRLSGQQIGWIKQSNGRIGVRFSDAWRQDPERKVLSLSVEETDLADIPATPFIPVWFENLLFEGELRRWIEAAEPEVVGNDMAFLARIGEDLLGAATLHPVDDHGDPLAEEGDVHIRRRTPAQGPLHWSLAGVQLKLNVVARDGRYTLPVRGELGEYIAKLADQRFGQVPQIEHATMQWARAAGINVADTRLITVEEIQDLPDGLVPADATVLLVSRFDRAKEGAIHAEEFAQALAIRPRDKYGGKGWRRHLNLVRRVCPQDLAEYLRRLVFVLVSGNSDAHHKNWSFIYPDGKIPRLSPAYDQVATVLWPGDHKDQPAFKLANNTRWERITKQDLLHELNEAGIDRFEDAGAEIAKDDRQGWIGEQIRRQQALLDVPVELVGTRFRAALHRHWAQVPLLRSA